ncbi:hypothetical protein [Paragemmobacter straminiformis]|uniref:Uncharacterized protein n=1 Tax=Paragemmobacter straminiformis TaxID=2045119 RepID=A0A842I8I4_9RHOB|nr:hypothetical protein [Gemmobacter straminiformis]MBC2835713.1 hypothetical protein [Gemmobacter straminiformis]
MTVYTPPTLATPRLWRDDPAYAGLGLLIGIAALPLLVALALDPRQFQDEAVWIKPLKFHAALVIYLFTLAFFARWVPEATRASRLWRWHHAAVVFAIIGELLWIGAAAALGTASHFNTSDPVWGALYSLMGLFAVILTSASLGTGIGIAGNRAMEPVLRLSLVLGLGLTFGLTLVTAGTMANMTGHFVGTPVTGARLPVFGWSREVGDLRVAHFFATHALHGVPLVGWLMAGRSGGRAAVWAGAALYAALVLALFWQGLSGLPVI